MNDKKYMVVDKETGEVVGETNDARERKHPVRRFLSWLALPACATAFYYIDGLFYQLVFRGVAALSHESAALRIIVYVLVGSTVIGALVYGTIICASATVLVSQLLRESARGTRYVVFAILWSLWYALMIFATINGIMQTTSDLYLYLVCGTMIAYLLITAAVGKSKITAENVNK